METNCPSSLMQLDPRFRHACLYSTWGGQGTPWAQSGASPRFYGFHCNLQTRELLFCALHTLRGSLAALRLALLLPARLPRVFLAPPFSTLASSSPPAPPLSLPGDFRVGVREKGGVEWGDAKRLYQRLRSHAAVQTGQNGGDTGDARDGERRRLGVERRRRDAGSGGRRHPRLHLSTPPQ